MPKREDAFLLDDIIEHAENIFQFIENTSY